MDLPEERAFEEIFPDGKAECEETFHPQEGERRSSQRNRKQSEWDTFPPPPRREEIFVGET